LTNTPLVGERRNRSTQANTVAWLGILLELAMRRNLPLATLDDKLKAHPAFRGVTTQISPQFLLQ
jgi:hypothetical protein